MGDDGYDFMEAEAERAYHASGAGHPYRPKTTERGTNVSEYDESSNVFEDDKVPALSFKEAQVGQSIVLEITRPAKLIQRRDFDSGEPAVYKDSGKPMMAGVFSGIVQDGSDMWPKSVEHGEMEDANPVEEERSMWVSKPSQPFRELVALTGRQGLNRALRPGDVIRITLKELKKVENSKMKNPKPQKIYKFDILSEGDIPESNAFGSEDPNE